MNDKSIIGNVLTMQLEQITPIIHFQEGQDGATLRATEVKPKLDKFLLTKITLDDAKKRHWLVDAEHNKALGYRLSFENLGEKKFWYDKHIQKIKDSKEKAGMPLFFGNTGFKNSNDGKELVYYPGGITMRIFSLHKGLLELIQEHIYEFFALNNFGTRQSKGYGSYYIKSNTPGFKDIEEFMGKDSNLIFTSSFTVDLPANLFDDISLFYNSMRSGVFPFRKDNECASGLYAYVSNKLQKVWDREVISNIIFNGLTEDKASKFSLYRDVMGLASSTAYGRRQGTITKKIPGVDRFKSPVFIKPVFKDGNSTTIFVYVGYLNISRENNIIGRTATIQGKKLSLNGRNGKSPRREIYPFKQIIGKDFNLREYFNYLLTDFSIEKYLPKSDMTDKEKIQCTRLKNIYNELKNNYSKTTKKIN